jgi:hypothetical protein
MPQSRRRVKKPQAKRARYGPTKLNRRACANCAAPLDPPAATLLFGTMRNGVKVWQGTRTIVHVDICGLPVTGFTVNPDEPIGRLGAQVAFFMCSIECKIAFQRSQFIDQMIVSGGEATEDDSPRSPEQGAFVLGMRLAAVVSDRIPDALLPAYEARAALVAEALEHLDAAETAPQPEHAARFLAVINRVRQGVPLNAACSWCFQTLEPDAPEYSETIPLPDGVDFHAGESRLFRFGGRSLLCHVDDMDPPETLTFRFCSQACDDLLRRLREDVGAASYRH